MARTRRTNALAHGPARRATTALTLLAGSAATVGLLTGCTQTSTPAPTTTVTTTATPSASASPASSPASSAPSTSTASDRCPTSQLSIAYRALGAAAGTMSAEIELTNQSSTTCSLQGWPGVSAVGDGHGVQLGAAASEDPRPGTSGNTPPTIHLAPGDTAEAKLYIVTAANYGSRCDIATADGFRVYPPGSYTSLYVAHGVQVCRNSSIKVLSVDPLEPQQ